MSFLIYAFLIASISSNILNCDTAVTTKNHENQTPKTPTLWKGLPSPRQSTLKIEELNKPIDGSANSPIRKSKILGSLAFLAGLSVAGLTGPVKTYAKPLPVTLNFDASRVSPHIAPIYGPYPYVPHPYIFTTPFGLYTLLSPVNLQPIAGLQNDVQSLAQQEQILNLLGNKKPVDLLNNNDEYTEEAKRVENLKTSNTAQVEAGGAVEFEDDRHAEEKMFKAASSCNEQKELRRKQDKLSEYNADDSSNIGSQLFDIFRSPNKTKQLKGEAATNVSNTRNDTNTPPLMINGTTTNNNTNNQTTSPPFYGYYSGYPQDIHHVEFTTETNNYKYHNYDHLNYNLPSYDKPENFYSDERYNYYFNPPPDASATNEFPREQIPEYLPHDFNRYMYTSYNAPPIPNNGFRPVA
nr:uncharacterized protein LOC117228938 [Megalopta genalis]